MQLLMNAMKNKKKQDKNPEAFSRDHKQQKEALILFFFFTLDLAAINL